VGAPLGGPLPFPCPSSDRRITHESPTNDVCMVLAIGEAVWTEFRSQEAAFNDLSDRLEVIRR
jgi:hypothetical protein